MFPLLETTVMTSTLVLWGKPEDVNLPEFMYRRDLILSFFPIDDSETILSYGTLCGPRLIIGGRIWSDGG